MEAIGALICILFLVGYGYLMITPWEIKFVNRCPKLLLILIFSGIASYCFFTKHWWLGGCFVFIAFMDFIRMARILNKIRRRREAWKKRRQSTSVGQGAS
jgi:hypothetical protein